MAAQKEMVQSMAPSEDDEGRECPICKETEMDVALKECLHIFHRECILDWIKSPKQNSNLCPICRTPLDEESIVEIDELLYSVG